MSMRVRSTTRLLALLLLFLALIDGAHGQNTGTPPPGTNLQPQTVGPTPVNSTPPPPTASGYLFDQGKPLAGFGDMLAKHGIYLKGFYSGTLYGVPSGGVQRTNLFYNEAFYGADFDLQKMMGLDGSVIHFSLDSRWGGFNQGVNNLTGFSQGFLAGSGPDNNTRLNEFTLDQHLFNDHVRFIVGRTTLASYFGTSELYCQFVSSICSNMVPFNWSSNSNSPFWPISTWAGEFSVWPTKNYYLRAGASESNPYQYTRAGFPWDAGWGTRNATGVYTPVEIGYTTSASDVRYPTKVDVGFYHDTSNFTDPRYNTTGGKLAFSGGTPANFGSSTGVYAQYRQMVWRPDPAKPQGVDVFAGALLDTSGHAFVQNYFEAGLVTHGTFPSRPFDSAGLLFTEFLFNGRQTGAVNDRIAAAGLFGNVSRTAQLIELNYGLAVAPGIEFKPFTDFTFHPDQNIFDISVPNPRVHYAWAVGGQFSILFNIATGLPSFFRDN